MNTENLNPFKKVYLTGLLLNVLSFLIYLLAARSTAGGDIFTGIFFCNFAIAIGYGLLLLFYKLSLAKPRPNLFFGCWINFSMLFTISAFSLNKEMWVFAAFPDWLNVYTLLMVALFLIYPFLHHFPPFLKALVFALTGSVFLFSIYMTIYLIPIMPLSVAVVWFFGISAHSFVTLSWIAIILVMMFKQTAPTRLKHFFWIGFVIPLLILGVYLHKWSTIQTQIKDIIAENNLNPGNSLPEAITLAQKLPSDPLTDKILISPFRSQQFFGDEFGFNGAGEHKFHDPLSLIAIAAFGPLQLDEETVSHILNIRKDYRHKTTEKLWTGISLTTSSVSNNIQVFPEYRIAYHEKTVVIHNDPYKSSRDVWFRTSTQEANYTFHVPEGSIVTSLSLWVNGVERKSRLTTQKKADSTYKDIVGVQRRDPAVVHWQEGNRVTVNVFPCTETENRTFKIGFTTPLSYTNETLSLENIYFEGPDFNTAREATKISFAGKTPANLQMPDHFTKTANGSYLYQGDYMSDWKIQFAASPLSTQTFAFNGYEYALSEAEPTIKQSTIANLYLDITNKWTRAEFDSIIKAFGNKTILAWTPEEVKVDFENKEEVWKATCNNQFSVPFLHTIRHPENTVIITKTGYKSPLLSDLKESDYGQLTNRYLAALTQKMNVIDIGKEQAPFWKSLIELRLIDYQKESLSQMISTINTGLLHSVTEDSSSVTINQSHLTITKRRADSLQRHSAPDHLLRLYAYNDVMRRVGPHYFEKEKYETEIFREAEEGYVVSPVTSMIVLETDDDYKQAGINENTNTIGNAGIIGGGAVPEPHEWALIILAVAVIARHLFTNKMRTNGTSA